MVDHPKCIGVLTGGGDCPGLNAVIRAVVKTSINQYGWKVLGIENGYEGLILPDMVRRLDLGDVRGILPRGGTILGASNRANPFEYVLPPGDQTQVQDVSNIVIERVQELEIDSLIVIGGDGSLRITKELMEKGLNAIGVPKTIDNDILLTDVTFGFDTALDTATEALDKLHTTAESHHRVMILEVMGRDAGWIALNSGIAGGADVILIPEIPYNVEAIARKIDKRRRRGAKFSIIVVAEGALEEGGKQIYQEEKRTGGMPRLGGICQILAIQLESLTGMETRVTILGHLQRGGSPTAFDRLLASRFGAMAVHLVAQGNMGEMVALQGEQILSVPIAEAVKGQKLVPLDGDILRTARSLDISLGDL